MTLIIDRAGPLMTVQDMGRPGLMAQGLSRGGAMDRLALIEAAALLELPAPVAGIEMAGAGGSFGVSEPMRIALTGAPMSAMLDDTPLRWHATHLIQPGQRLQIGGAISGVYGYLTPAGGIATPEWLGSRAAHLSIGIGAPLAAGDTLPIGPDPAPGTPARIIAARPRFEGGAVRVMDGPQTGLFDDNVPAAFFATTFTRAAQGNRQGVRFDADRGFTTSHAAGLASDVIGPGDLQMTGDGVPFALMAECQTIGGYPRIGSILPADLPIAAQAAPGAKLTFRRLAPDAADALYETEAQMLANARAACAPLIRDPATMRDLLSHQLIGGVTRGDELEEK